LPPPSRELDSTRVMPATALTDCSIGRVISSSISSGPTFAYVVLTVMTGAANSGIRSTGSLVREMAPSITITALSMNIVTGR
jgi:hypothetical protein